MDDRASPDQSTHICRLAATGDPPAPFRKQKCGNCLVEIWAPEETLLSGPKREFVCPLCGRDKLESDLEFRMSIGPGCKMLREGDIPGPCRRRWFWLLPVKHSWAELRYTKKYSYQECEQMGCGARRILQLSAEGYQPIARGWKDAEISFADTKEDRESI